MRTAISGNRSFKPSVAELVELRVAETVASSSAMYFGGSNGIDSLALRSAAKWRKIIGCQTELVVIVPFTIKDQPQEGRETASKFADGVLELKLPDGKSAYLERNRYMLDQVGADGLLLAFTDGRSGGTGYTIGVARRRGIHTSIWNIGEVA